MKKSVLVITAFLMAFIFTACNNGEKKQEEKIYYSVVFEANGGSPVETQKVEKGKTAQMPTAPVKEGIEGVTAKYFGAWYVDDTLQTKFDFETAIEKDTVLYASWVTVPEGSYLVSFDSKNDVGIANQIVNGGEQAQVPQQLTKTGYAFSYWYETDDTAEFDIAQTPINKTTALSAKWNHSGIYDADYEDDTLYSINVYDTFEADPQSGAW